MTIDVHKIGMAALAEAAPPQGGTKPNWLHRFKARLHKKPQAKGETKPTSPPKGETNPTGWCYFHFTIGPVQGFVAQARRTRDFWAGSFILSWLSAVAMRAVIAQQGTIVFPKPDAHYLNWLAGKGNGKLPPRQGSVPNRFKAKVKAGFNTENAEQVVASVQKAWYELAELVWQQDLAGHVDEVQRETWARQINHFWEISWVLTDDESESDLLDRRKNWRNQFAPVEPGFKCIMVADRQELSGILTPKENELKGTFWEHKVRKSLKTKTGNSNARDLAENEQLCAIAFVKRRFAHHFNALTVKMPGGWTLKGWDLKTNVPSVMYMAAVHWLETVIKTEEVTVLQGLLKAASYAGADYEEWHTDIACIKHACSNKIEHRLTALDGSVFFPTMLVNPNKYELEWVSPMLDALKKLSVKQPPSPFYAILLMDGDSLGCKMGNIDNQSKISSALQIFTEAVPAIVYDNNGFLVYAGGDDVLAILPLEDAFRCAIEIRLIYQQAFQAFTGSDIENSTISAAIEFVHVQTSLAKVLKDAHDLLDNVAKDGCGRDAIAVRVWKPGGKAVEWAMPWKIALDNNQVIIEKLKQQFLDKDNNEAPFSNNFFYKIRERFELLNPAPGEQAIISEAEAITLLAADYLGSGVNETRTEKLTLSQAEEIIGPLLAQCRQVKRDPDKPEQPEAWEVSPQLKVDGALLVRFLANKGLEY